MWEVWHFEGSYSASHACNVHGLHGSFVQSYGVRDLPAPTSLQANTNLRPNPAHLKVPLEWAWLELLVEKRQGHTNTSTVRDTKCSDDISSWCTSKAAIILSSHFAGVCPPSAIFVLCCSSRHTLLGISLAWPDPSLSRKRVSLVSCCAKGLATRN